MAEYTPNCLSHTPTTEQLLAQLRGGVPVEPLNRDRICPPTPAEREQHDTERLSTEAEFRVTFAAETVRLQKEKEEQAALLAGTVISLADWQARKAQKNSTADSPSLSLPYSKHN